MPKVDAYGPRQVASTPLPGARLTAVPSPDAFGAGFGEQAARIGTTVLGNVWAEEKQKADEVALLSATRQLKQWGAQRLYDPEQGALTIKGKDAMGLADSVGTEFDTFASQVGAGLTNDRQRLAFARAKDSQWESIYGTLEQHAFRERQAYDEDETKAFLSLSQSSVAQHADDPRRVSQELAASLAAVTDHAKRNGIGPEEAQRQREAVATGIHVGVIDQLLARDQDKAASAYYDETKQQISGDAQTRIERALEEGSLRGESQRRSDAILAGTETESAAIEEAKTIEDPKLRDEVQRRVVQEWGLRKQAQRDDDEAAMVTAANLIDKSPAKGVRAIPPATWSSLSVGQRTQLELYAKRNQAPADGEGNLGRWYELMQEASTQPEKFAARNLFDDIGRLGKGNFKQLAELQNSIRNRKPTDEKLDDFRTVTEIMNDTLNLAGIPTEGNGSDKTQIAKFHRTLADRVDGLQRRTGKKATKDDIQGVADDLLKSVTTQKGSWLGLLPGTAFFDQSKRVLDLTVDDIPTKDRQQIERALQSAGRPVSPDAVLNLYLATQRRLGNLK